MHGGSSIGFWHPVYIDIYQYSPSYLQSSQLFLNFYFAEMIRKKALKALLPSSYIRHYLHFSIYRFSVNAGTTVPQSSVHLGFWSYIYYITVGFNYEVHCWHYYNNWLCRMVISLSLTWLLVSVIHFSMMGSMHEENGSLSPLLNRCLFLSQNRTICGICSIISVRTDPSKPVTTSQINQSHKT